jgi:hypothetical protein
MPFVIFVTGCLSNITPALASVEYYGEVAVDSAYELDAREYQKRRLTLSNKWYANLNDDVSMVAIVRASYDWDIALYNEQEEIETYSSASRPYYSGEHAAVELREIYVDWVGGHGGLRIGKQQVVFGETDGIRVVDLLNPLDYSEFLLQDFEEMRIPTWMFNYRYHFDGFVAQFVVVPDVTTSNVPDGRYMPTSPRYSPTIAAGTASIEVVDDEGVDASIDNGDIAVRLRASSGGRDISLVAIRQYNKEPAWLSTYDGSGGLSLRPVYYRRNVFGATYSESFGSVVLRAEGAYSSRQAYYRSDPASGGGVSFLPQVSYGLAIDWYGMQNATVTAQLFQTVREKVAEELVVDRVDSTWSLGVNKTFFNAIYTASLLYFENRNDRDSMLRASLDWDVDDRMTISAGYDAFSGDEAGMFGQYRDTDRITLELKYSF